MTPKLEIAVLAGAESKAWLANFTTQVDRLEKIMGGKKVNTAVQDTDDTETDDQAADDDDFTPATKKLAKKAAASFDEDDAEEVEEAPVAKKKTAKGPTKEDVNDACKAYATVNGVAATKALLKKKFKTVSIGEIKPEQYQTAIDLMAVED